METVPAALEVGPPNSRSSQGGSFAARRQKNLEKFRRHIAAQRQTLHSTGASTESHFGNESAIEGSAMAAELNNQNAAAMDEISASVTFGSSTNDNNSNDNGAINLSMSPPSPLTEVKNIPKVEQGVSAALPCEEDLPKSALSPQAGKRRADIIKKLTKKNRSISIESSSNGSEKRGTHTVENKITSRAVVDEAAPLTVSVDSTCNTGTATPPVEGHCIDDNENNNYCSSRAEATFSTAITIDKNQYVSKQVEHENREVVNKDDTESSSAGAQATTTTTTIPINSSTDDTPVGSGTHYTKHNDHNVEDKHENAGDSKVAQETTFNRTTGSIDTPGQTKLCVSRNNFDEENKDNDSSNASQATATSPHSTSSHDSLVGTGTSREVEETFLGNIETLELKAQCDKSQLVSPEEKRAKEHNGEMEHEKKEKEEKNISDLSGQNGQKHEQQRNEMVDAELANSFDLRSIHEFPPETVKSTDAAMPSHDPSWDTTTVFFSEFQGPPTPSSNSYGDLDIFDTTVTNETENISFSQAFESDGIFVSEPSFSEVLEEKKEVDPLTAEVGAIHLDGFGSFFEEEGIAEAGSSDSNFSPRRRLSRSQLTHATGAFGFESSNLAVSSTHDYQHSLPGDAVGVATCATHPNPCEDACGDDEDLLGKANDGDSDQLWKSDSQLSKNERLEQYTSNLDVAENSSASSSNEEDDADESSRFSQEILDVEYMSHSEDDLENTSDRSAFGLELEKMPTDVVANGSAFSIPVDHTSQTSNGSDVVADSLATQREIESMEPVGARPEAQQPHTIDVIQTAPASSTEASLEEKVAGGEGRIGTAIVDVGYISNSSSSSSSATALLLEDQELVDCANLNQRKFCRDCPVKGGVSGKEACTEDGSCKDPPNNSNDCGTNEERVVGGGKSCLEGNELQESASLVGVTLVPSWGHNATHRTSTFSASPAKARSGIPPRGSLSPTPLPPPPPPPQTKRKKKKKAKKNEHKKVIPLIAPPPEEKLKEWEDSKKRATVHFSESISAKREDVSSDVAKVVNAPERVLRRPLMVDTAAEKEEPWKEPPESPNHLQIMACGDFPNHGHWALAKQKDCAGGLLVLAGLVDSPTEEPPVDQLGAALSPVDAARSIALENALRRANEGASRANLVSSSQCFSDSKSMLQNENGPSASILFSSTSSEGEQTARSSPAKFGGEDTNGLPQSQLDVDADDIGIKEPPDLERRCIGDSVHESINETQTPFFQKLISLSHKKSNESKCKHSHMSSKPTSSASPIISDSKMAEKVALASYAAAKTFEEQYSSTHANAGLSPIETADFDQKGGSRIANKEIAAFFCTAQDFEENIQTTAVNGHSAQDLPSLLFGQDAHAFEEEITGTLEKKSELLNLVVGKAFSKSTTESIQDLKGGAFSPWKNAMYAKFSNPEITNDAPSPASAASSGEEAIDHMASLCLTSSKREPSLPQGDLWKVHEWLTNEVLNEGADSQQNQPIGTANSELCEHITKLLGDDDNLNKLCLYTTEQVNQKNVFENEQRAQRNGQLSPRKKLRPFLLEQLSGQKSSSVVAANFVSFMHRISKMSEVPSPFGDDNPFLLDLVGSSIQGTPRSKSEKNMQEIVFSLCPADRIAIFTAEVCGVEVSDETSVVEPMASSASSVDMIEASRAANLSPTKKTRSGQLQTVLIGDRRYIVSDEHPSPFEVALRQDPKILIHILENLGDPAAVSRLKMVNRDCRNFISPNEHRLMRDAARLGGLSMNIRPSFWLWVALEKCGKETPPRSAQGSVGAGVAANLSTADSEDELLRLEEAGRVGKWHNVIERDVARAFGNMPPHKTGARLRTDSIVRALVTWGQNRIMKRGVKGNINPPQVSGQHPSLNTDSTESDASQSPTETVSDWGGVSPVASFTGSANGIVDLDDRSSSQNDDVKIRANRKCRESQNEADLFVLSGNTLTDGMKADLQNKLAFILHTLAATHNEVGYCQGMDYVVAHLLRILQDTIRWRALRGTLPSSIRSAPKQGMDLGGGDTDLPLQFIDEVDKSLVVEETVFKVMDCLFTTYNLQHMYWPELRCLKTCCRVFERLIQLKLPVLADHFEHHELNVGLFALGWFQTLFLYLPSMPSATVCHMWDIWLVERSFKIFFRVGTAILFLSQPILLNHELEGMMTYLNTFPDATLLNPDILIACALQIKVTNRMLMEIEAEVCGRG